MIEVLDVSSNNPHPINWRAVKASGVAAVIVKITEGGGAHSYINPCAAQDIAGARAAGLPVAAYHFLHPTLSIQLQLALILKHLNGCDFVWVDSETAEASWTAEGLATHAMCNALAPHVKTGLYSNPNFLGNMAGAPWSYVLWLAEYGPRASYHNTLWQFTDAAKVPGIAAPCDLSSSWLSPAGIKALFGPAKKKAA